jgi:flavodoxin
MKDGKVQPKTLIIQYSYHHRNTEKIAHAIAGIMNATITTPQDFSISEFDNYDLIGFGSGIYSGKHHTEILNLAAELRENKKKSFIFSTSAMINAEKKVKDHEALRNILESKGMVIIGEFSCKGFNTNSFLKYFGGMNKGKPDSTDIKKAETFALKLLNSK